MSKKITDEIRQGIWECLTDRPDVTDPDTVYDHILFAIGPQLRQIEYGDGTPDEYK